MRNIIRFISSFYITILCINISLFSVFANQKSSVFGLEENYNISILASNGIHVAYIDNVIKLIQENRLIFMALCIALIISIVTTGMMIHKNKKIHFIEDKKIVIKQKKFMLEQKQDTFFNTATAKKKRN